MLKLKKTLLVASLTAAGLLGASSLANAAVPGFYVGGQAGVGDTHFDSEFSSAVTTKDTGLAGRIFTGYQFDQNWAVELGYTKFRNSTAKAGFTAIDDEGNTVNVSAKDTLKEQAIDLVGKGILPLQDGFALYGKLGAAWLDSDIDSSATITGPSGTIGSSGSNSEHKILPTFGVGLSYDITPNVPVDISWNRIQKVGGTDMESTDLFSIGVAYNFG